MDDDMRVSDLFGRKGVERFPPTRFHDEHREDVRSSLFSIALGVGGGLLFALILWPAEILGAIWRLF